jgi:hypothetical protein
VRRIGRALSPFVEQIVSGDGVTFESQHDAKFLAEPFQRFIPVAGDRCRYNIVLVNLM